MLVQCQAYGNVLSRVSTWLQVNEALLKELPPPIVALEYYRGGDLYMFDDFQTSKRVEPRRPPCRCNPCREVTVAFAR